MKEPGLKHVAREPHGVLELIEIRRHTQHVAVAHSGLRAAREIDVLHRRAAVRHDALEPQARPVRIRREPPRERDQLRDVALAFHLVDRGPPNLAIDRHRRADRRHEDRVARDQPRVGPGVTTQQQIVKVEPRYRIAGAHQRDVAQGTDSLHAAARVERVRDRREARHEIRAGPHDVAEHEYADRAQLPERDARAHADHLLRHARRDRVAQRLVRQAADRDGSDLRKRDRAVAAHNEPVVGILIAEQLHIDRIARADHIVHRHWNVDRRCKRIRPGRPALLE